MRDFLLELKLKLKKLTTTQIFAIVASIIILICIVVAFAATETPNDNLAGKMDVKIAAIGWNDAVPKSMGGEVQISAEDNLTGSFSVTVSSEGQANGYIQVVNNGTVSVRLSSIDLINESNRTNPTCIVANITGDTNKVIDAGKEGSIAFNVTADCPYTGDSYTKNFQFKLNYIPEGDINSSDSVDDQIVAIQNKIAALKQQIADNQLLDAYPVGSIYVSVSPTNPSEIFGGTWESYGQGRTIVGTSTVPDQTGGASSVTLTSANIPAHTHKFSASVNYKDLTGKIANMATQSETQWITSSGVFRSHLDGSYLGHGTSKANWDDQANLDASHNHTISGTTTVHGSSNPTALDIQNPYITVYMWQRTS